MVKIAIKANLIKTLYVTLCYSSKEHPIKYYRKLHKLLSVARLPDRVARHPDTEGKHPDKVARHPAKVARHPDTVARHPDTVARDSYTVAIARH